MREKRQLRARSGSRGARDSLKVDSSFCRETYTVSVIPKSLKLKQSNGLLSVFMRCHLINRRKQFRLVYDAAVRQALCDAKER
ncbi:hypothetical protein E4J45_08600 [Escherichia coli]|nr:hypothetical protein [Escherichia coli]